MSINKNALIRYQTLDKCFRNPGRMYFWEDLLEVCNRALREHNPKSNGIQRRQLFEDIRFMESEQGWSIPLERKRYGRRVYYRYSDLSFSINNQPLNDLEVEQIKSAVRILSRFTGTPQFEWINELIPMLESKLGLIKREKEEIISYDSNVDLKGLEFLPEIFNAIVNKRVLDITYQDFKSPDPYNIIFHPYYLKQYNNRWFVLGLNEKTDNPYWNMALDRIVNISEIDYQYKEMNIEWDEYFFDIIGVTRPQGVDIQEIKMKFSNALAPYIITKPLHPSQKHKLDATGLEVRLKVIPNYELERLILSFGESVQVLAPDDFREKIAGRINNMYDLY